MGSVCTVCEMWGQDGEIKRGGEVEKVWEESPIDFSKNVNIKSIEDTIYLKKMFYCNF